MTKNIIAHRGMSTLFPENTLASFNALKEYKVNWLETDVGITKDEHVVILHDDYLDRTTNGIGALTEIDYGELRKLSAGSWFESKYESEIIPSLSELVTFINESKINLNLELKAVIGPQANYLADSLIKQVANALNQIDSSIRVTISSFNPIMLMKLKNIRPQTEVAVLFEDHTFYEDWTLIMQSLDSKIIHPQNEHLTRSTVAEMKDYGYEVNVWTVDKIDRANELFNWGVDGIFTDVAQSFPPHKKKGEPNHGQFLTTWF